ncbi:hypothetical protein FRX31_034379 [Thalictrum thalictroides]|uniref:Uncharacterized protein n=1 Tax=Thalictrum thalictroides TaxID=46969 RepID=A0A7J6UTV3_THATH|nr:hypothetical protein FRX31_034379 [Thalictrum thalictroides]
MGDSSSSTQNEETIVGYNTYNPCYYFELAARGVLKCLGFDSCSAHHEGAKKTSYEDDPPTSTEEQGMKSNEDVFLAKVQEDVEEIFSYTEITIRRGPPRPPVGTGRPPGIN